MYVRQMSYPLYSGPRDMSSLLFGEYLSASKGFLQALWNQDLILEVLTHPHPRTRGVSSSTRGKG